MWCGQELGCGRRGADDAHSFGAFWVASTAQLPGILCCGPAVGGRVSRSAEHFFPVSCDPQIRMKDPASVPCCCTANCPKKLAAENNKHLTTHFWCGSGIWVQLNSVPLDSRSLPRLQSRCPLGLWSPEAELGEAVSLLGFSLALRRGHAVPSLLGLSTGLLVTQQLGSLETAREREGTQDRNHSLL